MAPVAIDDTPIATQTIESIKQSIGNLNLDTLSTPAPTSIPTVDLRKYSSFDNSPSIGTEFREFSKEGKPVLDIRAVLGDEAKLKALGRLVYVPSPSFIDDVYTDQ
jgi:hypothetical protein